MEIFQGGLPPSVEEIIGVVQSCRQQHALENAKRVHTHVCDCGLEAHAALGNHLIPMYVDCGGLQEASQLFNILPIKNEHSWTSLIQEHILGGNAHHGLSLFFTMQEHSVPPSRFTLIAVLKACAHLCLLEEGRKIHACIVEEGYETDVFVGSILMDMYVKCGSLVDAKGVFDELQDRDVVLWTVLIAGYVEHGLGEEALICMDQMQMDGISPNDFTFACSLKACGSIGDMERGREIHGEIVQMGLEDDLIICNTLLDMYVRCCSLTDALEVFDSMSSPDVVSWTAMMAGYLDAGFEEEALNCFQQMQARDVSPSALTFSCCLKACATLGVIERGLEVHSQTLKQGLEVGPDAHSEIDIDGDGRDLTDIILRNAIIDMYGKCGSMVDAQDVFDSMPRKDSLTWTSLIMGYAQHGESGFVCDLFEKMGAAGLQPDEITFLSVLTVCSHVGLVTEGYMYFESMIKDFNINSSAEYRNCMVDLLCRAGQLNEAVVLLRKSFARPSFVTWVMLLDACHKRGNLDLARNAFDCALRLDESLSSAYVVMSNVLANAEMRKDVPSIDVLGAVVQACDD